MNSTLSARIAHVLFLNIVGYSRETTSVQSRRIQELNAAVNAAPAFAAAKSAGTVQHLHTGDGMALAFFNDVLAPVQATVEISRVLRTANLPLRTGQPVLLPVRIGADEPLGERLPPPSNCSISSPGIAPKTMKNGSSNSCPPLPNP